MDPQEPIESTRQHEPMPRWVKVSGAIAAVVIALFVIVLLVGGGGHGPGRHSGRAEMQSGVLAP